jgi:hypothetical protein
MQQKQWVMCEGALAVMMRPHEELKSRTCSCYSVLEALCSMLWYVMLPHYTHHNYIPIMLSTLMHPYNFI